jgi:hypothetical protein
MKGLIMALVLIVVVVVGLGFYMGWWSLSSGNADSKTGVTLTVNNDKIGEDAKKLEQKVEGLGHQANAKVTESTGQSKE